MNPCLLGPVTRLSKLSAAVAASGALGIFLGIAFKMAWPHISPPLCVDVPVLPHHVDLRALFPSLWPGNCLMSAVEIQCFKGESTNLEVLTFPNPVYLQDLPLKV